MKNKKNRCVPLQVLRNISRDYPNAWEQMDYFHSLRDTTPDMTWPEWYFAPMSAAIAVVEDEYRRQGKIVPQPLLPLLDFQTIDALAPWRHSKQIYRIDPDLEAELLEDPHASDLIPAQIVKHLPYPCVYIQTNSLTCWGEPIDGFFAHLEYDTETKDSELRFLPVAKKGRVLQGLSLHIDQPTMKDSFVRFHVVASKRSKSVYDLNVQQDILEKGMLEMEEDCRKLLPLVVYICSDENDQTVAKPSAKEEKKIEKKEDAPIRDRYDEVQEWNVGYRIGPAIRKYHEKRREAEGRPGAHTPKRPHIRRAHWHHFWTGAGESRHLIVKWIPPVFVNAENDEDLPATVHRVEK